MKRHFVLSAIILMAFSINALSKDFYDINNVNKIELTFSEDNWDEIMAGYYSAGNDERLVGTAVINGVKYDSVGVRYKGGSSYTASGIKKPLNIKLDHIIEDQKHEGYGTLKLSNGFMDPSFVREVLGYEIARKYTPASQANFINVYINGELIGLYISAQSVDKSFLAYHYYSNDNTFIKGDRPGGSGVGQQLSEGFQPPEDGQQPPDGQQLPEGQQPLEPPGGQQPEGMRSATLRYLGSEPAAYYDYYDMKSDGGWEDLVELCDTLNNDTANIENILNVDRALWHIAFHNVLVSLDSPINAPRNFYLYKDNTGRFNYIFWDLNMILGTNLGGVLAELDPFHNIDNPTYPIVSKLLQIPEYKRVYIAHMKTILEENFSNGWYKTRIREIQNIIDADVQADPNKFYSYDDFINNIDNSVGSNRDAGVGGYAGGMGSVVGDAGKDVVVRQGGDAVVGHRVGGGIDAGMGMGSVVGIAELMEARVAFLNNHPAFLAPAPVIKNISVTFPNSSVWINAEVSNANLVRLGYRQRVTDKFEKVQMFDDGNHNDGAASDGVYGVSIQVIARDVQYYIYAENNDAAVFSPERAEYKFHTLPLTEFEKLLAPAETKLLPNYPNPFNIETWIPFQLAAPANVVISIYNLHGQLVRKIGLGKVSAGVYVNRDKAVYWNGRNDESEKVSSGLYFYRLEAGDFSAVRKMVIIK